MLLHAQRGVDKWLVLTHLCPGPLAKAGVSRDHVGSTDIPEGRKFALRESRSPIHTNSDVWITRCWSRGCNRVHANAPVSYTLWCCARGSSLNLTSPYECPDPPFCTSSGSASRGVTRKSKRMRATSFDSAVCSRWLSREALTTRAPAHVGAYGRL